MARAPKCYEEVDGVLCEQFEDAPIHDGAEDGSHPFFKKQRKPRKKKGELATKRKTKKTRRRTSMKASDETAAGNGALDSLLETFDAQIVAQAELVAEKYSEWAIENAKLDVMNSNVEAIREAL